MGQGIHTRGGGEALGHGAHHIRIHNGHFRDVVGIHADEFTVLFHIRDHIVDGDLRSSAGGGGHGNGEYRVLLGGGYPLQAPHVRKLRIVYDDADGLGGIHAGAAANGYDAVCAGSLIGGYPVLHVLNGGIGLDVAVDGIGKASCVQ